MVENANRYLQEYSKRSGRRPEYVQDNGDEMFVGADNKGCSHVSVTLAILPVPPPLWMA
jgi:hypothetical protein